MSYPEWVKIGFFVIGFCTWREVSVGVDRILELNIHRKQM